MVSPPPPKWREREPLGGQITMRPLAVLLVLVAFILGRIVGSEPLLPPPPTIGPSRPPKSSPFRLWTGIKTSSGIVAPSEMATPSERVARNQQLPALGN